MARPRLGIPSYRLHAQSGLAVVTLTDITTGTRRDVTLGKYNSPESKQLYERTISRWIASGRHLESEDGSPDEISNNELVLRYLEQNSSKYETRGRETCAEVGHLKAIGKIVRELYGEEPARSMSPKRLKAIRSVMVAKKWTRKQINRQVVRLRRIYAWGASEELIPGETIHALKAVAPLKVGEEGVRIAQGQSDRGRHCSPHATPKPVAALVEFMLHTGCRGGEAAILRTCDLDRSGPVWLFRPMFHKTEKHQIERTVLVGPEGQRVLGPWLNDPDSTVYCFSPKKAHELKLAERAAARKTPARSGSRVRGTRWR